MTSQKLSNFEIDELKEVLNIGASHASTALSKLVGRRVLITVPQACDECRIEDAVRFINLRKEDRMVTAIILRITGDFSSLVSFFLYKDAAYRLVRLVTKNTEITGSRLSNQEKVILKEIGDIICGATLGALSKFLKIPMLPSISELKNDRFSEIIEPIMAEVGRESDLALAVNISFKIEGEDIDSQLCLFLNEEDSQKILVILKSKEA